MNRFSIIIPLYNRPQEIDELLNSLTKQTSQKMEIVVVEDGSTIDSKSVVDRYRDELNIVYLEKPNGGPADARNFGAKYASGEYFVFLDSDVIVPPNYLSVILKEVDESKCDVFGGPDKAQPSFTVIQKAINYSMTSFITTGGIRGGKKKLDKFYPRSFNMGIRREAYEQLGGFSDMRFGEDVDFSIRLYKANYLVVLIPEAWVYHKRRVDFFKFYRQVYNSGLARINLYKRHPESLKIVHVLPAIFTLCLLGLIIGSPFNAVCLLPILLFVGVVLGDSFYQNRSFIVATYSLLASLVQLIGYGSGFIFGVWNRLILKRKEASAFRETFYK